MLMVNALLGSSERILENSPEFEAFSKGLNLFLTPTYPSFKDVCSILTSEVWKSDRTLDNCAFLQIPPCKVL
jgi:hypothetical protein